MTPPQRDPSSVHAGSYSAQDGAHDRSAARHRGQTVRLIGMNQDVLGLASPHGHQDRVPHEVLGHRGRG